MQCVRVKQFKRTEIALCEEVVWYVENTVIKCLMTDNHSIRSRELGNVNKAFMYKYCDYGVLFRDWILRAPELTYCRSLALCESGQ